MSSTLLPKPRRFWPMVRASLSVWFVSACWLCTAALAAQPYTSKQLDAFAARVGKTYWINSVNDRTPTFLTSTAANAGSFRAPPNEAFDVVELVGRASPNPLYKVTFESGRDGYIRPEDFHEEFNLTILVEDPQAEAKQKAQYAAEEDKKRIEWINSQPWSAAVKEAAIKRQGVSGMTSTEVQKILGEPIRRVKTRGVRQRGATRVSEEHWYYPEGLILVFNNGRLSRTEEKQQQK